MLHALQQSYKKYTGEWTVALSVVVWRIILEVFGRYANIRWLFLQPDLPTWKPELRAISDIWSRWDSEWYYIIIHQGYVGSSDPLKQTDVVFFPLYPYLVKLFSAPFGLNAFYVGSFLSFVFFVVACVLLYKLLRLDHEKNLAMRAIFFLILFPLSFFFIAMYTESLFLLLVVSAFYAARKGRWMWVGIIAFLLGLTRLVGVAVLPALAIEYLQQKKWRIQNIRADILWLGLGAVGLLSFMALLQWKVGDALAFLHGQSAWLRTFEFPWTTIARDYWPLIASRSLQVIGSHRGEVTDLLYFVFGLAMIAILFLRERISYAVLALCLFIPAVTGGQLTSMGRYLVVIFPLFLVLARFGKHKWFEAFYVTACLLFFAENVMLYVLTHWIA